MAAKANGEAVAEEVMADQSRLTSGSGTTGPGQRSRATLKNRAPRAVAVAAIVLLLAGLLGLMAYGLLSKEPVTGRSGMTRVSKPAPDFTLPLLDGGELALSQYMGNPMVINFWASWCPPCRQESLILERAWRSYTSRDVMFVGVDIQDSEEDARAYVREFGLTYPNGLDVDGKITVDYGVIGLPVTFFVNRDGIVVRRWVGAISETRLAMWLGELMSGVAPSGEAAEGRNLEDYFELE